MCYQSFFPSQIGIFQTHPAMLSSNFYGTFDPRLPRKSGSFISTDSRVPESPSTPLRFPPSHQLEPRTEIEEEEKDASKRESDVETHPLASPKARSSKPQCSHVVTRSQMRALVGGERPRDQKYARKYEGYAPKRRHEEAPRKRPRH
jgi:hypothetical protein